uniref:Uncharacterized protein n=1 Tax=Oryzias sinensis TaxID=183150 RepID=A0A8C7XFB1_9TELE
ISSITLSEARFVSEVDPCSSAEDAWQRQLGETLHLLPHHTLQEHMDGSVSLASVLHHRGRQITRLSLVDTAVNGRMDTHTPMATLGLERTHTDSQLRPPRHKALCELHHKESATSLLNSKCFPTLDGNDGLISFNDITCVLSTDALGRSYIILK